MVQNIQSNRRLKRALAQASRPAQRERRICVSSQNEKALNILRCSSCQMCQKFYPRYLERVYFRLGSFFVRFTCTCKVYLTYFFAYEVADALEASRVIINQLSRLHRNDARLKSRWPPAIVSTARFVVALKNRRRVAERIMSVHKYI